ncbi:unnamed protein product [Phytophthora fragariaefolia]|uniref:Unnamed protein product n=1 Tax=Phytophthora fragariaefolia TaxID=1490495 RepID=A0A9W6X1H4_9STRA|nr:unnamed protein product [Phytophthora fragariaefolia]
MARGQSPLAQTQARTLRALGFDDSPPAASPETSVSVMTPPSTSVGAGGDSPSRPPPFGVAVASAPSSPTTASTGDASGAGSEPSLARPVDAVRPVSVSSSGASSDGARSVANAPEASSVALGASRFSSDRWEDIEDIVTTGPDRTVRQVHESTQSHFLALARLVVDLNRRSPIRTDNELDQRLELLGRSRTSVSGGASSTSASAMPAAFVTFLEELGALHLAIPPQPATSGSSASSGLAPPASSGSLDGTAAKSGSSTSLTVDSGDSDDTGPIVPSALHNGKGKRPAKSPAKLQSAQPTPKKKQRLGRPLVDLKTRKAAKQAATAVVSSSGPHQSVPSSLPAASPSTPSESISRIAVSADSDVLSFASIPSGSDPPFSRSLGPQHPQRPIPPAPVVATPTPRQASASRARTVVTATLSTMPVTRSMAFEPVTAIPAPIQGPQSRVRASRKLPDMTNPLLEPAFTTSGTQEAWCEILIARIPQPIASDWVAECSIAGIQAFADWEGPLHPCQRLRSRLPESPCTFGADDFMPDKPISIRASRLAIVVKLWRQFTGRAVGRSKHSDLVFALWERAHWIPVAAVEQWLQQLSDRIGPDTPEYLETEAAWRAYNKAQNLRADRLRLQIPKRFWVWCTPDASGKIQCPPEILLETSMLQYSFETLTWAPSTAAWTAEVVDLDARQPWRNRWGVGAAIVVNPALRQSHVTAPWVQEFSDARAQAAADASAATASPSDASSARIPIPAADQADVQAELGATAPAQARLDVLTDLATTAEI